MPVVKDDPHSEFVEMIRCANFHGKLTDPSRTSNGKGKQ
jgi:hypothetical protein